MELHPRLPEAGAGGPGHRSGGLTAAPHAVGGLDPTAGWRAGCGPNIQRPRLVSLGGATEAAIWSIWHPVDRVEDGWRSVPYGRAMANQRIYVLDEAQRPCPIGEVGQLHIGGMGLAAGYWQDEAATAASFIRHPDTGERLYRTGDYGRVLADGGIEFLGRRDAQVKIGGYRIELAEVEAGLQAVPEILEAVAFPVTDFGRQPAVGRGLSPRRRARRE